MKTKICTKCGIEKELSYFYKLKTGRDGLHPECKICLSIRAKKYRKINEQKKKESDKKYRDKNKKIIVKNKKKWYEDNIERERAKRRIYQKEHRYENNKRKKSRYHTDIEFKILEIARSRIRLALQDKGSFNSTTNLLGCTIKELKQHLESQFTEGMNWDNYGLHGWHIDHKIPCTSFDLSDLKQQKKCFHYTNLQPLWAEENYRKSNKLDYEREFKTV